MSPLFSPFAIGPVTLPNRIVIPPMCQYSAQDGEAGDWHRYHMASMALSGAGLYVIEATGVTPEGRISPHCLGLYSDATEAALRRVLDGVRRHSAMPIAIQLNHAGRKGSSEVPWKGGQLIAPEQGGWRPLAPSALWHLPGEATPDAMSATDLVRVRDGFVDAARRAARLGLDVIELHAAHGYLLHEFLSPLSNARDDAYGGSLAHRMRFPLEVFEAVRAAVPASVPVGFRISATDWVEGGWELEQSVAFGHAAKALGCAFMDVSTGGLSHLQKIALAPGYQVSFAETLRREVGLPTIAVGLITEPAQAEAIVAEGQADLVAIGRAMLFDPHWPWKAAAALGGAIAAPPPYWRSQPRGMGPIFGDARIGMR